MSNKILPPKIAIIIPVYNVGNYLSRCLDSCVEQTLYDIEIICVDDGSTDRSPEILDYYAKKDSRIRVLHRENSGVSAARNAGIRNSSAAWIMFVDSDDYLAKNACETIWKESLTNPCEIIVHGGCLTPDYPKPESWKYWAVITRKVYYPEFYFSVIQERGGNPFLWLQAYSRDLIERTGTYFHEDISFGEDLIFQFEHFPFAKGVSFISDRVYYYRWYREGSLMKEAMTDLDARTSRHISNIGVIASYWETRGILRQYGKEFLAWALGFVVPDLEKLELQDKSLHAEQLNRILKQFGLSDFRNRLNHIGKRQYKTMIAMRSDSRD